MIVKINKSFDKDISKIKTNNILSKVYKLIIQIQKTDKLTEIKHLKRLKGGYHYYRIRIGDYRVGIVIENETIEFVRFLHRKDIYKYFP